MQYFQGKAHLVNWKEDSFFCPRMVFLSLSVGGGSVDSFGWQKKAGNLRLKEL